MKILLVMDKRVDRGSIQAAANYLRAGDELGAVAGEGQAKGLLYFALQKDGQPVDPAGVMALE